MACERRRVASIGSPQMITLRWSTNWPASSNEPTGQRISNCRASIAMSLLWQRSLIKFVPGYRSSYKFPLFFGPWLSRILGVNIKLWLFWLAAIKTYTFSQTSGLETYFFQVEIKTHAIFLDCYVWLSDKIDWNWDYVFHFLKHSLHRIELGYL